MHDDGAAEAPTLRLVCHACGPFSTAAGGSAESMKEAELTSEQAGRVYDRIGRFQDWQNFYEGPALGDLGRHADFEHAKSIFELGCGTGAMARNLLDGSLSPEARYMGVDVSRKMVGLASERLAPFGDRATIELVNGEPPLPAETGRFDRFVALYVFDLLPATRARDLLDEARRLLSGDGRLCLVSLTHGTTRASRGVCALWNRAWQVAPAMVGGCRPVDLTSLLDGWQIAHVETIVAWAVPSQIVVATP
jgi:ubiquinone/menaquinone biosynthesis C-methylase UbiE